MYLHTYQYMNFYSVLVTTTSNSYIPRKFFIASWYERLDPYSWWSEPRYLEQLLETRSLDPFQGLYRFQLDKLRLIYDPWPTLVEYCMLLEIITVYE
jgi:hypothetical protein